MAEKPSGGAETEAGPKVPDGKPGNGLAALISTGRKANPLREEEQPAERARNSMRYGVEAAGREH